MNHWAILVCAVFQWILGALWYSPVLFAKPWMAMVHVPSGGAKKNTLLFGMVSSFIGSLILSLVLLHIILWSGASTWGAGAFDGVLCWLGFVAAPNFAQGIYESRPFKLFAINTGYWLVGMGLSGILLAVWR
jgi:hypothetical protein